jgi:putative restriction endonuclease
LSNQHRAALNWFHIHRGTRVPWPERLPDGTFLLNRAKGIHKPAGWKYTLRVRQALGGPYADQDPEIGADGSWAYRYFQEGANPTERDQYFTNRALLANSTDGVPIGVLRQVSRKPEPLYEVLGLANVAGWEDGYFKLVSVSVREAAPLVESYEHEAETFDPTKIEDARRRILAEVVRRQGQPQFRSDLLRAYGGCCAISGCDVVDVFNRGRKCVERNVTAAVTKQTSMLVTLQG